MKKGLRKLMAAMGNIERDMEVRRDQFLAENKPLEAERIEQRVRHDMEMMQEFTRWAEDEAVAGCRLSVVGEPTPDGSCGTDLGISGVCMLVSSDSPEGCWEFIKYRLTHPYDYPIGLCLYRPVLERRMEAAVSDPQLRFTAEDRDRFLRLLDAIQYPNFYDPMVLSVIEEESGAFLAGERSAADTARLIQSRLSLYVSEQS